MAQGCNLPRSIGQHHHSSVVVGGTIHILLADTISWIHGGFHCHASSHTPRTTCRSGPHGHTDAAAITLPIIPTDAILACGMVVSSRCVKSQGTNSHSHFLIVL